MNLPFNVVTVSVLTCAYLILFPLALSANVLLIYIVFKRPNMRTTINFLFANMAAANLLVAVFIIPDAVRYLFVGHGWFRGVLGELSCRLVNFTYAISIAASILSLIAISLDQFYAILFPMKRISLVRKTKRITTAIWLTSVLLMSPYLALFGIREKSGQSQCVYVVINRVVMEIHFSSIFVLFYALPLVVMVTLYALIGRKLWFRTIPGNIHSIQRQAAELSKRRVIRMLIVVIATFALCWLPVHVFHMCAAFKPEVTKNMASHWSLLIVFIAHTNSALNPCLEIALNRKFRSEFLEIWKSRKNCWKRCLRRNNGQRVGRNEQNNNLRLKSLDNLMEGVAKKRGRFYELGPGTMTYNHSPEIALVQFSYYNNACAVDTES